MSAAVRRANYSVPRRGDHHGALLGAKLPKLDAASLASDPASPSPRPMATRSLLTPRGCRRPGSISLGDQLEDIAAHLKRRTSLGRWGQPEEIAGAVAFLASLDASYITGQVLAVDGGYLAHF